MACRASWKLPGCGRQGSVDSSQRRKPAGPAGSRAWHGTAFPTIGPTVNAAPGEGRLCLPLGGVPHPGGMGDAHHREPLPRPISSLATGEEAPSIQAPRRSAGVSAAVGPRIGGQPDQGDAATLGLSPLAGAHTNVRAEGASTKPCLLGWPGLHTCGQRAAQRLWNPGDDGPAQGQVWALCWLSPSWEPGPGPGLDRKSWFPPKPENMRLWPRAPGRPSRACGQGGWPPSPAAFSPPGLAVSCPGCFHVGLQQARLLPGLDPIHRPEGPVTGAWWGLWVPLGQEGEGQKWGSTSLGGQAPDWLV